MTAAFDGVPPVFGAATVCYSCFVSAAPRLQALCGEGLCLSSRTSLRSATHRARREQGGMGPPAGGGLGSAPRPAPPPFSPRPLLSAASRLAGGGSRRRLSPAHVEPFPVRPPPPRLPSFSWPSPQDSQCASGQTYLRQPTTFKVLASPVASNPNFLLYNLSSSASLQTLLRLACLSQTANRGRVYYLFAPGTRRGYSNGCQGQRGTPAAKAFCAPGWAPRLER